jgi:hypothetical protein
VIFIMRFWYTYTHLQGFVSWNVHFYLRQFREQLKCDIGLLLKLIHVLSYSFLIITVLSMSSCRFLPCKNGGQCYDIDDSYMCSCNTGFTGYDCEIGKHLVVNLDEHFTRYVCEVGKHLVVH